MSTLIADPVVRVRLRGHFAPTDVPTDVYLNDGQTIKRVGNELVAEAIDKQIATSGKVNDGQAIKRVGDSIEGYTAVESDDPRLVPTGAMMPYAGTEAPTGWLLCDGSAVLRETYADLFGVIGTVYGVGDGSTTFNLPDCRQRFLLGKAEAGTGATLGETGGAIDHTHDVDPAGSATGAPNSTATVQSGDGATVASSTHRHSFDAGNTTSTSANPPYIVLNFIIKT